MAQVQPQRRVDIPGVLDALGVPGGVDDPSLSKAKYIELRFGLVTDADVTQVAEAFLAKHTLPPADRFALEELLWAATPTLQIPKRTRYEIAKALESLPLFLKSNPFLEAVDRLWSRETVADALLGDSRHSLIAEIERHVVRNPNDWSTEYLFDRLGAFDVTDKRVVLFIEALVSADVRPDEGGQREFAAAINAALSGSGLELREVDSDGGFPVFRFASTSRSAGRPKNLIFASHRKPDLRFRDAVNNDIEILNGVDDVLVYDRPIPPDGLRWRDLQAWWAEIQEIADEEAAKRSLYARLLSSLPPTSPAQTLLFKTFFQTFGTRVPDLPALLPEVWLHWDPKTVRERGVQALSRFRMDFLLLLSHDVRIVIEVDGLQHYADEERRGDPLRYAAMVRTDRELRLSGYDVFRFGTAELGAPDGPERIRDFFERLFRRYGVRLS
jgi:hypothetical protein